MQNSAAVDRDVFVSRFNRVLAVVVWALDAFVLAGYVWVHGGLRDPFATVPVALVALLAWVALWRPSIQIDDDGIRVVNVFRTIEVPWPALIHIDTKYALTLFTPGHRYSVWAAPAPGRTGAAMAARKQERGRVEMAPVSENGSIRPGDLIASESGQAAYLIRERWARLRDAGHIDAGFADETPVHIRVHWWLNGIMAAPLIATVLVFVL
ncbi:hypothetical protein GCM10028798_22870 [Humibacter antri]